MIKIPEKKATIEFEIKKSKFIAIAELLTDPNDVKPRIKEIRESNPGCKHVVYAFFIKDDRSISGLSDDGEPHGTAGRPIYEVLKGSGITDILISVTRYFGGTKLGTGGLVSAYSKAAKDVLEKLIVIDKIYTIEMKLKVDYKRHEPVKKVLYEVGALDLQEEFGSEIFISAFIPEEKKEETERRIQDVTQGEIQPVFFEKILK
jgi:uncharacterized YigZ family protein